MAKTIDELDLDPVMKYWAEELQRTFPDVVFTSGRRNLEQQARAMAVNHIEAPESFLTRTYTHGKVFLAAVVDLPTEQQKRLDSVAGAIQSVLQENPDLLVWAHRDGTCVDLLPMLNAEKQPTKRGRQVIKWIRACPATVTFLEKEGGLDRWHWGCHKAKLDTTTI